MQRILGWTFLVLLFGGLLVLVTWATYGPLREQRGIWTAIAVWPGMAIGALLLLLITAWAIRVTAPRR